MGRVHLGDVAREVSQKAPEGSGLPTVGLEHLDPCEVELAHWDEGVETTFTKGFEKGQVLFGRRRAYLHKAAVAPFAGVCSGDITVIAAKDGLSPRLLPFIIQNDALFEHAVSKSAGSLSPRVKWQGLAEFEFELPAMTAQEKLADILWAAQETRHCYKRLLEACDGVVKSQFIEMFGDPVLNSQQYTVRKLADLGELNRGVSKARPRNTPDLLGGPYPLIQTGEVAAAQLYIDSYENTYSEKGLAQSRMWPKGTLCITIAANIAQTAILAIDACFPDSVVGFIPGDEVTQIYMHYWFSFFQKILDEQAPQVAQKNINLKILSNLDVMVPPLELQKKFEDFVEQSDKSKFAVQKALDELNAMTKKILNQELGLGDV